MHTITREDLIERINKAGNMDIATSLYYQGIIQAYHEVGLITLQDFKELTALAQSKVTEI